MSRFMHVRFADEAICIGPAASAEVIDYPGSNQCCRNRKCRLPFILVMDF